MKSEIEEFTKERNEALLSLDEQNIRAMFKKWNGVEFPDSKHLFWASVHKAITGVPSLPIEFRKKSKEWLDGHGMKSFDDGDL